MSIKNTDSLQSQRCSVKNCQKVLEGQEFIKIRDQLFCKPCAVLYFTGMLGGVDRPQE